MATQTPIQPAFSPSAARLPLSGAQTNPARLTPGQPGEGSVSRPTDSTNPAGTHAAAVTQSGETGPVSSLRATGVAATGLSGDLDISAGQPGLRLSAPVARLPVALAVMVPVRGFRVRHLLAMSQGEVIEARWGHGEDLPLSSGEVQVAWSEFEVMDSRLAVRITRLA